MELSQHGFLEELVGQRRDSLSSGLLMSDQLLFPNSWAFEDDGFEDNPVLAISSSPSHSPYVGFSTLLQQPDQPNNSEPSPFTHDHHNNNNYPFHVDHGVLDTTTFTSNIGEDDQEDHFGFNFEEANDIKSANNCCKVEMLDHKLLPQGCPKNVLVVPSFNVGVCGGEKKGIIRPKKLEGQPSKNLMAERRRRKRLNDRLSMLRSIVPKISKMDRTSILGDTIDYMKELLERINKLQEGTNEDANLLGISKDLNPNDILVRNSPKFDVDRREMDTRIDICCAAKPGLLMSTVNTLEALGLEIQQCVISCFNDFSMQASCSEVAEQRSLISSEDVKQAIFRNAGYGGRCL